MFRITSAPIDPSQVDEAMLGRSRHFDAFTEWHKHRATREQERCVQITEWTRQREAWAQAAQGSSPALQTETVLGKPLPNIKDLDKSIQFCQTEEIKDLKAGLAHLDLLIPLLMENDRNALSAYNKNRIDIRSELIQAMRALSIIPDRGGEVQLLKTYRDSLQDGGSGPSMERERQLINFAVEAQLKIRRALINAQKMIDLTEGHSADVKTNQYLGHETRQIQLKNNQWTNHSGKLTILSQLGHLVLFQLSGHPACRELETEAYRCLRDFYLLTQTFMWACDPDDFAKGVDSASDPSPRVKALAATPWTVSERIEALQGLKNHHENLKQKFGDLHRECEELCGVPNGLPKSILDYFDQLPKAIDSLQASADETLAQLLPDEPQSLDLPATEEAWPIPQAAGTAVKPKTKKSPRATAPKTKERTRIKIKTEDGVLVGEGDIHTHTDTQSRIAEFRNEQGAVLAQYEQRTTAVLGEHVWVPYDANRSAEKIENEHESARGEVGNVAQGGETRSTEKQEAQLLEAMALGQGALDRGPKWLRGATAREQGQSHDLTPSCVGRYLFPYRLKLDDARAALTKARERLERAAKSPTCKRVETLPLCEDAAEMERELQKQVEAVRGIGLDAAIRIARKQAPTEEALIALIELGVITVKKVQDRTLLGSPPANIGQVIQGADLKQRASQPGRDYLDEYEVFILGEAWCVVHGHSDDEKCRVMHLKKLEERRLTNRPSLAGQTTGAERLAVHYGVLRSKRVRDWIVAQAPFLY